MKDLITMRLELLSSKAKMLAEESYHGKLGRYDLSTGLKDLMNIIQEAQKSCKVED